MYSLTWNHVHVVGHQLSVAGDVALARLLQLPFVGAVDELPRKVDPVAQVVTEMCLY